MGWGCLRRLTHLEVVARLSKEPAPTRAAGIP
jgi:hypothetical protein